jgi:DNA-binding NarL/FixJ family response regulator
VKIDVLIVDDLPQVRQGLRMRLSLEPDLQVVGEAADGAEAVERVRTLRPDVVLMDLHMPGMDGLAATREVANECKVLMLSVADTGADTERSLAAGACRYICKKDAHSIVNAIRRAMAEPFDGPKSLPG